VLHVVLGTARLRQVMGLVATVQIQLMVRAPVGVRHLAVLVPLVSQLLQILVMVVRDMGIVGMAASRLLVGTGEGMAVQRWAQLMEVVGNLTHLKVEGTELDRLMGHTGDPLAMVEDMVYPSKGRLSR
jgi:hypothetical protein